jgi:hypothetical protein
MTVIRLKCLSLLLLFSLVLGKEDDVDGEALGDIMNAGAEYRNRR